MHITRRAGGLVVACTLLAGCATERTISVKPPEEQKIATTSAVTSPCQFSVKTIIDSREQMSLGMMGLTHIDGAGFQRWFESGISTIPGYRHENAPIELRIEVLKAYIQGISTLKSANLVVRVHAIEKGNILLSKTYRSFDNSINWFNSESEIQTTFNNTLTDLKHQIHSDISILCKN